MMFLLLLLLNSKISVGHGGQIINYEGGLEDEGVKEVCMKGGGGQFSHPHYCDVFVECWEGEPVAISPCPHALLFNPQGPFCDYPAEVDCTNRTLLTPQSDEPDENCKETYGTFPGPTDMEMSCSSTFVVCQAGSGSIFHCPPPTLYHRGLGVCVRPDETPCPQQSQPPPPNDPPSSALEPPDMEPLEPPFPSLDPDKIKPTKPVGPVVASPWPTWPLIYIYHSQLQ